MSAVSCPKTVAGNVKVKVNSKGNCSLYMNKFTVGAMTWGDVIQGSQSITKIVRLRCTIVSCILSGQLNCFNHSHGVNFAYLCDDT
jgi:hypothetical protein